MKIATACPKFWSRDSTQVSERALIVVHCTVSGVANMQSTISTDSRQGRAEAAGPCEVGALLRDTSSSCTNQLRSRKGLCGRQRMYRIDKEALREASWWVSPWIFLFPVTSHVTLFQQCQTAESSFYIFQLNAYNLWADPAPIVIGSQELQFCGHARTFLEDQHIHIFQRFCLNILRPGPWSGTEICYHKASSCIP